MKTREEILSGLSTNSYFIDTHCHLDMDAYHADLTEVLESASIHRIGKIVSIGINLQSSIRAITLAGTYPQVFATIGIHPHDVDNAGDSDYKELTQLYSLHKNNIVGYGEIGLDYVKQYSDPKLQRYHFSRQLELADDLDLPVVIHNREADEDTLKILRQSKPLKRGGIMHCFSGDYDFAKRIIDLGMLISIPGIVTFKNAHTLQDVAAKIPLSAMILETDGPFLAPHPFRGKRNEPANVLYTAAKVAGLRNSSIDEIAVQTTANAENIFNLQ